MQVSPGIIVLDGADVAGKTTLAGALTEKYGGHYIHATYKFKKCMDLYHLAIIRKAIKLIEEDGKMVVVDRWWPSEMIYGDVYRAGARVSNAGLRILHRLGLRHGVSYVICYRDRDCVMPAFLKAHSERAEMYAADERMLQVHDGYQALYESIQGQQSRWHHYNVDRAIANPHYFTAQLDMIGKCSQFYDYERHFMNELLPHSVGATSFKYLMVGERINPVAHALDYPWIGFKGISLKMAKALGELGVPEHDVCWTNVMLPNGKPNGHLNKLLRILRLGPKVVAMGDLATRFCKDEGRCDYSMPHPSYITRFQGFDSLVNTLGEIFK